jgi:hypothetical protein
MEDQTRPVRFTSISAGEPDPRAYDPRRARRLQADTQLAGERWCVTSSRQRRSFAFPFGFFHLPAVQPEQECLVDSRPMLMAWTRTGPCMLLLVALSAPATHRIALSLVRGRGEGEGGGTSRPDLLLDL